MKTVDLFSGAGGFSVGFRAAGFESAYANDINSQALDTYALNIPETHCSLGSVEDKDPALEFRGMFAKKEQLDALIGGPPCQGFSINAPERFLEDPRNGLFTSYLRFLDHLRPKCFAFENVPGMLSLESGRIFKQIVKEFESRGYSVSARILLSAHYGVPQIRHRLVILGTLVGNLMHPKPTHHYAARANFTSARELVTRTEESHGLLPAVTVSDAIDDLPSLSIGEGHEVAEYSSPARGASTYARGLRARNRRLFNHVAAKLGPINVKRLQHIPAGGSWRDIPHALLPTGMKRARRSDHTKRYGRLEPDSLSGTVMTKCDPHWGAWFHYDQDRTLTAREAARIQSFPDAHRFLGPRTAQFEQVGNAVPPLMAAAIGRAIRDHITSIPEASWQRAFQSYSGSTPTTSQK